jgi:thioredoxin-related protein
MKKLTLVAFLSFIMMFAYGNDGIKFDHESWTDITKKAKKAKKLIFIDCYTSWCGPCKMLSKQIFPLKNVGDYFNANFINYKSDMENGEGVDLKNKFHVGAFPTLLWVDHKGNVIHRVVGFLQAEKLLAEAKIAVEGGSGGLDLEKKYKKNKKNPDVVKEYLNALIKNYDSRSKEVALHYLTIIPQEQYLEDENWAIISRQVSNPFLSVIEYVYTNRAKFEEKFKPEMVDMVLNGKYYMYANSLAFDVKNGKEFDEEKFQKLIQLMEKRNFDSKNKVIEETRLEVLKYKEDWTAYIAKIENLLAMNFYKRVDFQTYYQWYTPIAASNTKDVEVIKKAISWVDKANELNDYFRMFYFKMYWEAKIKLTEKLGTNYKNEVAKMKVELEFIKYLEGKQADYDKKLREEEKKSRKGKKSRGIPAMRMQ